MVRFTVNVFRGFLGGQPAGAPPRAPLATFEVVAAGIDAGRRAARAETLRRFSEDPVAVSCTDAGFSVTLAAPR